MSAIVVDLSTPARQRAGFAISWGSAMLQPVRSLLIFALMLGLGACSRGSVNTARPGPMIPAGLAPRFLPPEGWAWGHLDEPGGAFVRYGVAAPSGGPRASVILIAGPQETAELYFETARDLIARGCTVWVLDPAATPDAAAQAVSLAVRQLVRPTAGAVVIVAGGGSTAPLILQAANSLDSADLAFALWSGSGEGEPGAGSEMSTSESADGIGADHGRSALAALWFGTNPGLRHPERMARWVLPALPALAPATKPGAAAARRRRLLLFNMQAAARCPELSTCTRVHIPSGAALPFADDASRGQWLDQIGQLIDQEVSRSAHDATFPSET